MSEVKPCPNRHCGSADAEMLIESGPPGGFDAHRVRCLKCGLTGPKGVTAGQAKAVWNDLPREPEMGIHARGAAAKLVGLLADMIQDKTGYSGVYLICADGARVSTEYLMCLTDAWDVVHESKAKEVGG